MKAVLTIIATALVLSLPLSAQAGFFGKEEWEKEDCPKNHSLAWCLADYQGRSKGINDMSKEEFVAKLKQAGMTDDGQLSNFLHSSLGVGIAVKEFESGILFGGGVYLLDALMPDRVDQNRRDTYMVFFDETNNTERGVVQTFRDQLIKAVRAGISALPHEATVTNIGDGLEKVTMPGSNCTAKFDCLIAYGITSANLTVEIKNTPAYLGGAKVFSPETTITRGVCLKQLPHGINVATLARVISENLPESVYWFIPTGYLGGNPFPLFLNHGKAMFFVRPDANSPIIMPHVAARQNNDPKPVGIAEPATKSLSLAY